MTSNSVPEKGRCPFSNSHFLLKGLRHNKLNLGAVETLLAGDIDLTICDAEQNTVVHWAAYHGRDKILASLLRAASSKGVLEKLVNKKNSQEKHPLLDKNENHSGQGSDTAAHLGVFSGCVRTMAILASHGWDLTQRNANWMTPFLFAAMAGEVFVLQWLQEKYVVDLEETNCKGHTALHLAAQFDRPLVTQHLLRHGFDGSERDTLKNVPGHYAARSSYKAMVVLLRFANPGLLDFTNDQGQTVRKSIKQFGSKEMIVLLNFWEMFNAKRQNIFSKFFGELNKRLGNGMYGLHRDSTNSFRMTLLFSSVQILAICSDLVLILPWILMQHPESVLFHYSWIVLAFVSSAMWCKFSYRDPGVIPQNYCSKQKGKTTDSAMVQFRNKYWELLEAGYTKRLCPTCMIVKPFRSKHSAHNNRCIRKFDHHCTFLSAPIGGKSYRYFMMWSHIQVLAMLIYDWNMARYLWETNAVWYNPFWAFNAMTIVFLFFGFVLLFTHWTRNIFRNFTTNEQFNYRKYKYLQTHSGSFHNPFDLGTTNNIKIFFGCKTEPVIEVPPSPKEYPPMCQFTRDLLKVIDT